MFFHVIMQQRALHSESVVAKLKQELKSLQVSALSGFLEGGSKAMLINGIVLLN